MYKSTLRHNMCVIGAARVAYMTHRPRWPESAHDAFLCQLQAGRNGAEGAGSVVWCWDARLGAASTLQEHPLFPGERAAAHHSSVGCRQR